MDKGLSSKLLNWKGNLDKLPGPCKFRAGQSNWAWGIMKFKTLVVTVLALSGCVSSQEIQRVEASQRPPSPSVKASIVNAARDYLVDPYSVRDAEISSIVDATPDGKIQAVCVKANSKNRMGGYTGRTAVSVRLVNNKPVGTLENAMGCHLPNMKYFPFPELEALKNV